jgi:hypothetical protein
MRKLILILGTVSLAACSQAAPEAEAPVEAAVEEPAAEVGGPGTYEVTYEDGTVATMTTTAEGTFSATQGDLTSTGTTVRMDKKVCFDAEGDEEGPMCWTPGEPAEDGSWVSTSDAGESVTVKPVA